MTLHVDLAIVGAGPAGLSAAVSAARNGLSHLLIEKADLANTVRQYQAHKLVMAEPARLPLRADLWFEAAPREVVLQNWGQAASDHAVCTRIDAVTGIHKQADRFELWLGQGLCTARHVVLAVGLQGTPRCLGVEGESLGHVSRAVSDPQALQGLDILVVGAGDVAIENALALKSANRVSLLNPTADFARVKESNHAQILAAIESDQIRCFYNASVMRIEIGRTWIATPNGEVSLRCNRVLVCIGSLPPRGFLETCGVTFPGSDPAAFPWTDAHHQSSVPGLYLIGSVIGYPLIKHAINQGYEVVQHILGKTVLPADQPLLLEKLALLEPLTDQPLDWLRQQLPLFQNLNDPQFRELVLESTVHAVAAGQVVIAKNDYSDTLFNVITGAVDVVISEARRVQIDQGSFFGEMGLFSGRRRSATVRAREPGLLLETPRNQMIKLMSSVASIQRAVNKRVVVNALKIYLLPALDIGFVVSLAERTTTRRLRKGEVLFREGDPGDAFYVINRGSVKLSQKNSKGLDVTRTFLSVGRFVGEMALLGGPTDRRLATVSAAVACEVIELQRSVFAELLARDTDTQALIDSVVVRRHIRSIVAPQNRDGGEMLDFLLDDGLSDAGNILLIDSDRCVDCDQCERACAATHDGQSRLHRTAGKSFSSIQIPVACRHCENPLCMLDCPPDALLRMPSGEVLVQDNCIGCGRCVSNCPYDAISLATRPVARARWASLDWLRPSARHAPAQPASFTATKCDMCSGLAGGPACVLACPTGAAMRVSPLDALNRIKQKHGESW